MKTVRVASFIQEGSLGYNKIKQLESVITSTYHAHFGTDHRLVFVWVDLPYEHAYLAGKLSTTSTVTMTVEDGTTTDKRHPFMSEVCAKWQHITGCHKNELILNVTDESKSKEFMKVIFNERFNKSARTKTKLKLLATLLTGRVTKGYLNASVVL